MTDFDSIFRKYHHRLFLYTLKFVEDESDALDIVQNVFVAVWESGKFRSGDALLQSYLFNAVKNSCLNHIKHQKVIKKFEHGAALELKEMEAIHYQSGEKSLIENESLKQIEDAVDSLTDIYKEVIVLSRFEGLKNSEIAERLQIPIRTVETRIFRALSILKERISRSSFFVLLYLSGIKKFKSL
jgi:RNA polymerase sigma-70 factor (ECF subfamily)